MVPFAGSTHIGTAKLNPFCSRPGVTHGTTPSAKCRKSAFPPVLASRTSWASRRAMAEEKQQRGEGGGRKAVCYRRGRVRTSTFSSRRRPMALVELSELTGWSFHRGTGHSERCLLRGTCFHGPEWTVLSRPGRAYLYLRDFPSHCDSLAPPLSLPSPRSSPITIYYDLSALSVKNGLAVRR